MKPLTPEQSMYTCVRCGACRDACPTLDITGREADGPRGRVLMARSLLEDRIPVNAEIEEQMSRCLLCSACVDACPVNVQVPEIVMLAKEKIAEHKKSPFLVRTLKRFFFNHLLPHPRRLQFLGHLLWLYQQSGLRWLVHKLGILKLFPDSAQQMEAVLPDLLPPSERKPLPSFTPGCSEQNKRAGKVALFRGCIMDVMFRETNRHSIELLARSGFDVVVPDDQVCCGALMYHNGQKDTTLELAKKNIEVFEKLDVDYIISNAGGCGAMLKEYEELFRHEPEWLERARAFCHKIRDISEVIVEQGTLPKAVGNGETVTYQPSCHLQYVMQVKRAPEQLLSRVANLHYRPLPESNLCCGSAGIYNLLQPKMAGDILHKKMGYVKETSAHVIITANPGCLLQMKAGVHSEGLQNSVKVVHIVDLLAESVERAEKQASTG
ncbi:glycolate oxidase iron-sulfur subunit [Caldalkalibacillus uzonensis]|uniref:Glycolate oxidase iron-sulfur subunit n=1 Tax=Caldalkalibacillus uzonensis TaxID=353224 RepID=A0ABU0CP45_9BACI|nr:(Fe-S)-binding protein [Caldalkalibacillus uzonensis]MDQ0338184.1 glycolate oxidase iron-sulfur subunit [Caldalkalibacillus uzonensis]